MGFYIEPIPTFVFTGLNSKLPFEKSKTNITEYDYSKDSPVFPF